MWLGIRVICVIRGESKILPKKNCICPFNHHIHLMMQLEECTKPDLVYRTLEGRIVSGVWKIGDQIPTEIQLAAEFGLSRGTVSKAIARLVHDGLVQRRTRAGTRVIRTSVERKQDRIQLDAVAFIYPSERHEAIRQIVEGFQQAAHEVGRRTVTLTTGTDFRKEAEIVGRLSEFDVKGAVVYPVLPEPKDRLYFEQMLLACRFPVVLADITLPGLGCPAVVVDNFHAGHTMTRHLTKQGLRRIGFLSNGAWVPSIQNRYGGYRWALEEAGLEEQPGWALMESSLCPDFEHPVEKTRRLTNRFLEDTRGLDGVVCGDDFLALSCLASARELGIRVPEDLKVVGISDYTVAAQSKPSLTTYHTPHREIGRQAFQLLNRLLQGEKLPMLEARVRGRLIVRQSG
jgi:DNA-binding LacI/PurR family transcriptional regulator